MACSVRQKQKPAPLNAKAQWLSPFLRLNTTGLPGAILLITLIALLFIPIHSASANRALPTDLSYSTETTWLLPGLPDLSATSGYIPHNFAQSETIFQIGRETVHGFHSGKSYPEMYARNIPWELETAQYYYPDEYLREPVEAFLRRQYTSNVTPGAGAIGGIFSPQGEVNKQTITSDEETSLIHAAYLYYNLTYNTDWLNSTINNQTVIERLNLAADWLYSHRFDPQHRLFWRGNTTDWGNIKAEAGSDYSNSNSTDDHQIISIYDQALAYLVFLELAQMNAAAGDNARADQWQERSEILNKQANALLWQADKGFYQTRLHITPPQHTFNETEMVSISNALAVYAGLTDSHQRKAIFKNLEAARVAAGAKKPGVSIYPYYPNSYFNHPSLRQGYYQNGGIWDWWGGLQVKAEFLTGYSQIALTHLLQVANEWQKHPGNIIEWQSATDAGREGSHYYTAAAGTMGSAIIEGLFGIELDGGGLTLQPRLGLNDGYIRVYQPATDRYAAYSYDWSQNITRLDYGTNTEGSVLVKVLKLQSEHIKNVTINERPVEFEIETTGDDSYVVFIAPEGQHSIEIAKGQPATQSSAAEPIAAAKAELLNAQSSGPSLAPNINSPHQTESQLNLSTDENAETLTERYARESRQAMLQFVGIGTVITISIILFTLVLIRRMAGLNRQHPHSNPSKLDTDSVSVRSESDRVVCLTTPPGKNQSTQ